VGRGRALGDERIFIAPIRSGAPAGRWRGHLVTYLAEFDFRYSTRIKLGVVDTERARRAVAGATGKRASYQQPRKARES
jgi:hypothetical protein